MLLEEMHIKIKASLVGDVQGIELLPDVGTGVVLIIAQLRPLVQVAAYAEHPRLGALSLSRSGQLDGLPGKRG